MPRSLKLTFAAIWGLVWLALVFIVEWWVPRTYLTPEMQRIYARLERSHEVLLTELVPGDWVEICDGDEDVVGEFEEKLGRPVPRPDNWAKWGERSLLFVGRTGEFHFIPLQRLDIDGVRGRQDSRGAYHCIAVDQHTRLTRRWIGDRMEYQVEQGQ